MDTDDSVSRHRDVSDGDYSTDRENNDHDPDADDSDLWDSNSMGGGSSTRDSTGMPAHKLHTQVSEVQQLSQRTTRTIRAWRLLILILITVVGIGISVGAWVILSKEEENRFNESVRILYIECT